jgi:hypothetical protein
MQAPDARDKSNNSTTSGPLMREERALQPTLSTQTSAHKLSRRFIAAQQKIIHVI